MLEPAIAEFGSWKQEGPAQDLPGSEVSQPDLYENPGGWGSNPVFYLAQDLSEFGAT